MLRRIVDRGGMLRARAPQPCRAPRCPAPVSERVISNCMTQAFARPTCAEAWSGTCSSTRSNTCARVDDLRAFQRFEGRATLDPGAVRGEQRLERHLAVRAARRAGPRPQIVAPSSLRLDVGCRVRRRENAAQTRRSPARGCCRSRRRRPRPPRSARPSRAAARPWRRGGEAGRTAATTRQPARRSSQPARRWIELERTEGVDDAGHGAIIPIPLV